MRISDWSSDVCSSDLLIARDRRSVRFRSGIGSQMYQNCCHIVSLLGAWLLCDGCVRVGAVALSFGLARRGEEAIETCLLRGRAVRPQQLLQLLRLGAVQRTLHGFRFLHGLLL